MKVNSVSSAPRVAPKPSSLLSLKKMSGYCTKVESLRSSPYGMLRAFTETAPSPHTTQLPPPPPPTSRALSSTLTRPSGALDTTSTSSIVFVGGNISSHRPIDQGGRKRKQNEDHYQKKAKIPKCLVTSTPLHHNDSTEFFDAVEQIKDSVTRVIRNEKEEYAKRHEEYLKSFSSGVRQGMRTCANLFGSEIERLQSRITSLRDLMTHIKSTLQISKEELRHAVEWEEHFREFADKMENFTVYPSRPPIEKTMEDEEDQEEEEDRGDPSISDREGEEELTEGQSYGED